MSALSVFIDIQEQLQALLQAPSIAGAPVTLDHPNPLIKETVLAINIVLGKSRGQIGGVTGSPTDWATDFDIELYGRARAIEQAAKIIDPLLVGVWQRLYAGSAYAGLIALGVQDVLPDPELNWERHNGDAPLVVLTIATRIIHRTNPGSLTPWNGT